VQRALHRLLQPKKLTDEVGYYFSQRWRVRTSLSVMLGDANVGVVDRRRYLP
jgi:hypothetical protein